MAFQQDSEGFDKGIKGFFGPNQVDTNLRQTFQICWMSLSEDRRNLEEFEKEIRRLFDRALRDFRDDAQTFLGGKGTA